MAPQAPPSSTAATATATRAAPSARARRLARISGATHPLAPAKTFRTDAAVTDGFLNSKRDRRLMKHSSFVARVASSSSSSSAGRVAKPRTRRPRNKLKTSLDALADALPALEERRRQDGEGELRGAVRQRSMRSRPGALRRKELVVRGEMERFGATMASLAKAAPAEPSSLPTALMEERRDHGPGQPPRPPTVAGRWAALREYIAATVEQAPAFVGKK